MTHTSRRSPIFIYLLLLTLVFVLFETGFFLQWINYYLGDYKYMADHIAIPRPAVQAIIYFILIQVTIHFLYAVVIWLLARLIGMGWSVPWKKIEFLAFAFWLMGLIDIFFANQYFFPNSKFSYLISPLISPKVGFIIFISLTVYFLTVVLAALKGLFVFSRRIFSVVMVTAILLTLYSVFPSHQMTFISNHSDKPNIILIGIDSLRPDYLGIAAQTPAIDHFLHDASVFTDTVTPLARTFPSWSSLLTGQYPLHNHIRTNLSNLSQVDLTHTIPAILRERGYYTVFATDETRFSNIDKRFGFDEVIEPPMGLNDFLLGTLNDFPLSNLIINTTLGSHLFPNTYGNRGVLTAYDPQIFLKQLSIQLAKNHKRPLFLAVHFCLPHFPYYWGKENAADKTIDNYRAALHRVDQQFQDFMQLLAASGLLDKSVVVLLSDHGEGFEMPGDRVTEAKLFMPGPRSSAVPHFYPPSLDKELVNQSAGHGTDVLGLSQYRVLLAFRFYQYGQYAAQRIHGWTSLMDIKPTILSLLKLSDPKTDGQSLLAFIAEKKASTENDLLIESDFSPPAVRSVYPEMKKVLLEGMNYFQVDPVTTRVMVKKEMMQWIISSKQLADFYQNWVLALYPQNQQQMMPILVNLQTGQWTNDLTSSFALKSPANHMLAVLKQFYGNEITSVINA